MSMQLGRLCLGVLLTAWVFTAPAAATEGLLAQNTQTSPAVSPDDQSPAAELSLWNGIKESQNAQDFVDYLKRFPNGMFADPAKERYEALSGQKLDPALIGEGDKTAPAAEPTPPPAESAAVTKQPAEKHAVVKHSVAKVKNTTRIKAAKVKPAPKRMKVATTKKVTKKVASRNKTIVARKATPPKKRQVASKRKACNLDPVTGECAYAASSPAMDREVFRTRAGDRGGPGGGGGAGGGGTGGWH